MRYWTVLSLAVTVLGGCSGEEGEECTPNHHTVCKQGEVWWVDSCGEQGEKAGDCECGCNADFTACKEPCDCVPDCTGKECGDDGCGGLCPPGCGPGQTCNNGVCEGSCTPDCNGKNCGPDGCGGNCGECSPGYDCEEGNCVCNHQVCGEVCCAEGEICQNDECCLPDCAGKECGVNCAGEPCGLCAQGSFCSDNQCILAGVEDCWTGAQCPAGSPYCLMSCRSMENKCCEVMPDHPRRVDGSIDDSCEVCCTNPDFASPVLWPDGEPSCCATEAPYPFLACGSQEKMCCPAATENPRRCDGTIDDACCTCCSGPDYPVGVIFPDGHTSCCPEAHPWPCVQNGTSGCCDDPGQCG